MLVDTGSPVGVITRSVFEQHRGKWPRLQATTRKLSCFKGQLPIDGKLQLNATMSGATIQAELFVIDCPGPMLCGRDTIRSFNTAGVPVLTGNEVACVQEENVDRMLETMLSMYSDVFAPDLGLLRGPPVHLTVKEGARPRFCKARTVPYALKRMVSAELDRLVNEGVLSPVTSAEWATPVVPVVKKDGQVRLCGDFRLTVNAATIMEQYPLPRVDDIFANLNGGNVFSTLDLRNAYNQMPLDEDSKRLVVSNTHKGLYCFNRLAFGVSSAPAIFQRQMEAVLSGISRMQVYLDDIIVSEKANDCKILEQVP
ncbi:uncharacterized protein K02A2.6-like [Rhipicephalus sanguineus]|uniref:uncharacterized protein K02A2.6-like n=1 Tax=Rhipicephalus sanguineus TaxID=34632 RepID=UPI0020C27FC1|nr:uncharacterized protein K02A2.6-like [Rhipicephalus sanguineus]